VAGRTDVEIQGPGVIQRFERWGILLSSSDHVTVTKITVERNCWSGMQTISTSESKFAEDNWVNNAAGSNGAACGGVCLLNSNKNVINKSTFHGNGSVDYLSGNVDFGIGFEGSSGENLVAENDIGGNTTGVEFLTPPATTSSATTKSWEIQRPKLARALPQPTSRARILPSDPISRARTTSLRTTSA
jgi:nitrous oxidase accessory protein NosD